MAYQIFLKERRKKTMVTINEIIALAERAKNSGINRIYCHHTGGLYKMNSVEKEHYHSRAEALLDAESKLKMLTVYRWLTLRFPDVYSGTEEAQMEHERLNTMVERALSDIVRKREQDGRGAGTVRMKKSKYS